MATRGSTAGTAAAHTTGARPPDVRARGVRARPARVAAAASLAVLLGATAGCDGGGGTGGGSSPGASSSASQRPSRAYKDGHLTFTVLSLRCGLTAVTGSHADAPPDGQFCAVRLRVDNPDPNFHTYVSGDQRLEGVTGRRARPDGFAMAVRRQHDRIRLGGHTLVEVELWFDAPKDARVTGLRVMGDRDPASFGSTEIVDHAPDGVVIPMKPLAAG